MNVMPAVNRTGRQMIAYQRDPHDPGQDHQVQQPDQQQECRRNDGAEQSPEPLEPRAAV
jgi:hypothetical protein